MGKHFFKAPFKYEAYVLLRFESKKFATTEDGRFIVATAPITLSEYHVAFHAEVPFKAYVEDRAELVLPDDLEEVVGAAGEVHRNRGRLRLKWRRHEDFYAEEEVEIKGRLSGRGVVEVLVRGYSEVRDPYVCRDPDDCMWPVTVLTLLYELTHKYKVLKYRGADTVEVVAKLLSDPRKKFSFIKVHNADADEVEQLLRKAGFEVVRRCKEAEAGFRIEKISEGRLYVGC
jgi:hypothetical protein